jgi:geranylgeranyl pyrophosphate synthase
MSAVEAVTQAGGPAVSRLMDRLEERMSELVRAHGAQLGRLGGDTVAAGGKRLRPLLVFLAAGKPPPETDSLLRGAVAVELVHSATLVHDDVLDAADLRRGRPTVVAAAGRHMATATGDLLFSRAFAELAGSGSVAMVRALSRASSSLAAGELMQREDAYRIVSEERYFERCRLKTAVLFRAACEIGALEGEGPVEVVGRFGEQIGIAFQLLDDVLDVSGPPERTGKPRGTDLLDGTVTLPLLLARRRDPELAGLDPQTIAGPKQAAMICDRIAATAALETVRDRALKMVSEAKALLPGLPGRQREALELVADGVVARYS